jgi:K+-sensing histidine kinase KdpD
MTDDCSETHQEVAALAIQKSPDTPIDMDLYRAARIVKEHGGVLSAATLPSGGIRFTLELPAL